MHRSCGCAQGVEQAKQLTSATARISELEAAAARRGKDLSSTRSELEALHVTLSEAHAHMKALVASADASAKDRKTKDPVRLHSPLCCVVVGATLLFHQEMSRL